MLIPIHVGSVTHWRPGDRTATVASRRHTKSSALVGKSTMLVSRSNTNTPDFARASRREEQAFPNIAGAESRSNHVWSERGSASSSITGVLAVFFLVTSLFALYQVAQMPRGFSNDAHASASVRTIRDFYAGLDEFMETGDISAVSNTVAPDALAFVPEQGAMGADSGLLTYLLALRSTHPHLRFTIEEIDAGGEIAVASVRRSGTPDVSPLGAQWTAGISQEFFRVHEGRIVRHWTTAPGSVLVHPLTISPMLVSVYQPGHLAIAELIFSPGEDDLEPIEGPALIIVQHGQLTLAGNGFSQIVDLATGATSRGGSLERATAGPGQAIAVLDGLASIWNEDDSDATARIITFAEKPPPIMEYLAVDPHPQSPPINDISLLVTKHFTVSGAVTVRPLAFDREEIPIGRWELEIAWAVLGPGTSLPLSADGARMMAHIISGSAQNGAPAQDAPDSMNALSNNGDKPAVALVIRLVAAT